jgi:hypothetical protein
MGRHDDRSVSQSQRGLSCLSREDQEKIVSGNAAHVFHVGSALLRLRGQKLRPKTAAQNCGPKLQKEGCDGVTRRDDVSRGCQKGIDQP